VSRRHSPKRARRAKVEPVTDSIEALFAAVADQKIPGGCDRCDAYQVVTVLGEGVPSLVVHHTTDCPRWRSRAAASN